MLRYLERDIRAARSASDEIVSADDHAYALAEMLGIPEWRACLGYGYIEDGEAKGKTTKLT
jgi:hypothetical protein